MRSSSPRFLSSHLLSRLREPGPYDKVYKVRDAAPTRLALGLPGGFALDDEASKWDTVEEAALVCLPSRLRLAYPHVELPLAVSTAVDALLKHADAATAEAVASWEEERKVSAHAAALVQEASEGRRISPDPKLWRDAETGATDNLWLNLSDGYIGGGRQNWDGTGGSGSALRHFQEMQVQGRFYPLAVKLGTITARGADVYSYAEDDMVEDPHLAQHLAHWGIDVLRMEKTEKSMAELEIALNSGYEFDKILESGAELQPLSGPGFVGLSNLGNSCYLNSLIQLLKELPELGLRHAEQAGPASPLFRAAGPDGGASDVLVQMAKLQAGLLSPHAPAVRPARFKALLGRGHPEFSSARQQDVVEYFGHLLAKLDAAQPSAPPSRLFEFETRVRDACAASGRVRYTRAQEAVLVLRIPEDRALNAPDVQRYKERQAKRQRLASEGAAAYICAPEASDGAVTELDVTPSGDVEMTPAPSATVAADEPPVRAVVPFTACLELFSAPEALEGLALGGSDGRRGPGVRTVRLATFPPYLALQMSRFTVGANWVPAKLDVSVAVPERLSLEHLRAPPPPPDEVPLPPDESRAGGAAGGAEAAAAAALVAMPQAPDETFVAQLVSMGFSANGSRRAAVATGNTSAEASMEWVLSHMEDADFDTPLAPLAPLAPPAAARQPAAAADPESLAQLTSMGFSEAAARAALRHASGSLERAADWLFSQEDAEGAAQAMAKEQAAQDAGAQADASGAGAGAGAALDDGPGEYELVGFVSHMGASTACGHYVAHVVRQGRWALFNDEKVALSAAPPLDCGYLYLYRRRG